MDFNPDQKKFLDAVVKELAAHHGRAVVVPGEYASSAVHAFAAQINNSIGAVGQTVTYGDPIEVNPQEQTAAFKELVGELNAGKVEMLCIFGVNPVYTAPADLDFEAALKNAVEKGTLVIGLSMFKDETSRYTQWHINEAHYLESWSDTRAADGTVSIVQPLIAPLYEGKTAHEVVAALGDAPGMSAYDLVRQYWSAQMNGAAAGTGTGKGAAKGAGRGASQGGSEGAIGGANQGGAQGGGGDFETQWRAALNSGFIPNTACTARYTPTGGGDRPQLAQPTQGVEIYFRPDPSLYDGRFSNNSWLQEVSRPITKMSWDNAILIDVRTAAQEEMGRRRRDRDRRAGAQGGASGAHHAGTRAQCHHRLSRLRTHPCRPGRHRRGPQRLSDPHRRRAVDDDGAASSFKKIDSEYAMCVSRSHNYKGVAGGMIEQYEGMEAQDRGVVRFLTLDEFQKDAQELIHKDFHDPERGDTLYPNYDYSKENQWGMTIDANACVGCNACVVACQAENNIPTVGRFQQQIGREMLWLRIDTYYTGDVSNPRASFLPIPCMHCEDAPCEPVCPVGATVHSPEGLNVMVYNRCVGTRYCSNNCPYKVRRFNFLLYSDYDTPSLKLMRNPDVTVRSRGVMEKCTYCVQRITAVRIKAEKEERPVYDGEAVTACQQVCPTDAIVFGNINDPKAKVSEQKRESRNYAMIASINTRPRTSYLAGVINPNPELGDGPMPQPRMTDSINR